MLRTRHQFLQIHLEAALAGNAKHRLLGKSFLRADRRRKSKPIVPRPPSEPCSGFVTLEVLRRKHLVLADIRCDNRFVLGQIE